MRQLRERGIYLAPDGRYFVASKLRRSASQVNPLARIGNEISCFLFDRYQWAFHGAPDFEIGADGLVACAQRANWGIDHLIDTGTTAGEH
jgi:hypothetical protein